MTKPEKIAYSVGTTPYAWPGGYPRFAVTDDGAALCAKCCKTELDTIAQSDPGDGWHVEAPSINWEDTELYCDHCNEHIEAAYSN